MKKLSTKVGGIYIDHFAITCQPGRIITAVAFFTEQFGWFEDKKAKKEGDWGVARFVVSPFGFRLQITEPASGEYGNIYPETHLAFKVFDPKLAAEAICDWAYRGGIGAKPEEITGGKWFVTLPDIFKVEIELVPAGWDHWVWKMRNAAARNSPLEIVIPESEAQRIMDMGFEAFAKERDLADYVWKRLVWFPRDENGPYTLLVAHLGTCPH